MSWNELKKIIRPQRTKKSVFKTSMMIILPSICFAYFFGLFPTSYDTEQDEKNDFIHTSMQNQIIELQKEIKSLKNENPSNPKISELENQIKILKDAERAYQEKRYDDAIRYYELIKGNEQFDFDIRNNLAVTYAVMKQYPIAIKQLEELLKDYPAQTSVKFNLGLAHHDYGNYGDATKYFYQIPEDDPDKLTSLIYWADSASRLKQHFDAIVLADRALDIDKNNLLALSIKGFSLNNLGKYDEAIFVLLQMYEQDKQNIDTLTGLGFSYEFKGNFPKSLEFYEKGLSVNKESISTLEGKIRTNEKILKFGNPEEQQFLDSMRIVFAPKNSTGSDNVNCGLDSLLVGINILELPQNVTILKEHKLNDANWFVEYNNTGNKSGEILVKPICILPLN